MEPDFPKRTYSSQEKISRASLTLPFLGKDNLSTFAPFRSFDPRQASPIGSLWRRILAFAVDSLILYVVGRIVGATFFDTLSRLGLWGHLLGFILALAYFATLDSGVGGGQTLGKRLLRLRVVNAQGNTIPWGRSAVRYVILATPYFLTGPRDPAGISTWLVPFLIIFTTLGIGGSTLYLVIFNRRTRQGLHDIAIGTYVVDSIVSGPLKAEPICGAHGWVIGFFLCLIAFTALSKGIDIEWQHRSGHVSPRLIDERLIEKLDDVQTAKVLLWRPTQLDGSVLANVLPKKTGRITVEWKGEMGAREALADQVASLILQNDPGAQKQDLIRIEVGRSYDLGIAFGNDYQNFTHTPEEWHQRALTPLPDAAPVPMPQQ